MPCVSGRCLCGAITFRVLGEPRDVVNCHCARCRRFTGHYLASTSVASADLVVDDSGNNLRWFYPVPEAGYGFCVTCGSSLFWQAHSSPDTVSVCAGTLDPPTHLRTTLAWWVSEASDYLERPDLPELQQE